MLLLFLFALLAGAAGFLVFKFATVVDGINPTPFLPTIRVSLFPSDFSFHPYWVVDLYPLFLDGCRGPDACVSRSAAAGQGGRQSRVDHWSEPRDWCTANKRGALEENEEGLKATFNVNVIGTINLTRLLAPYMLDRGMGHFVVMSSAAGKVPAPDPTGSWAGEAAVDPVDPQWVGVPPGRLDWRNGSHQARRRRFPTTDNGDGGDRMKVEAPPSNRRRRVGRPTQRPYSHHGRRRETAPAITAVQIRVVNDNFHGEWRALSSSLQKRVSVERCAELTIVAATHGLKEAWISYQPVLTVMYLVQYMPTVGYWLMDKVGAKRLDAAAKKRNTYSWNLMFSGKKSP
nr:unnamed protein product [Digitaria exilis]